MQLPRVVLVSLLLSLTAACSHLPSAQPPPAARSPQQSFLKAIGTDVVDASGETVLLKGCNLGGWLLIEPWILGLDGQPGIETEKDLWDLMEKRFGREAKLDLIRTHRENFFTEADARRIADAGMNCVRVPIWWRAVSDPEYGGDIAYLDRCIEWCKRNGLYVIVDLHGAPGGQGKQGVIAGERSDGDLWRSDAHKAKTVEWWRTTAQRYKNEPAVAGYDILNEAFSAPYDDLIELYDQLYREIRKVDPQHMIIVEDALLGFHRMPLPCDRNWVNVVYSFHYYPQSREEGLSAAGTVFPRFRRATEYFGVPVLVGEYNSMFVDRGGADVFRRYGEVFGCYGWSSTFWTYKKIEDNTDTLWGLYGYYLRRPVADLHKDSLETIKNTLLAMRTENGGVNELMLAALKAPSRLVDVGGNAGGRTMLTMRDANLLRAKNGDTRIEWGMTPPNVGFWKSGDSVGWKMTIPSDGNYEFALSMANNADGNVVRIRIDGVRVADAKLPNTGDWKRYTDCALGTFRLAKGVHTIELSQADGNNSFMNLRHVWFGPSSAAAAVVAEDDVVLTPFNMSALAIGSPLRVEWLNDPPDLGYWQSKDPVPWSVRLDRGGTYRVSVTYSTPNKDTTFHVLVDGKEAASAPLAGTGDWQEYRTAPVGQIEVPAGAHIVAATWDTASKEGAGNLQRVLLERSKAAAP